MRARPTNIWNKKYQDLLVVVIWYMPVVHNLLPVPDDDITRSKCETYNIIYDTKRHLERAQTCANEERYII